MKQQQHKMNVVQLTIITVVNMMGSGIIMLPSQLAEVGNISIFSWLVTAIGAILLAYSFAKCGRFSKKSGGMGGYAEYAFGKSGNMMANYTYAIALVIANVAIAITAVGYFGTFLSIKMSVVTTGILAIVFIWLTTVANFWGAKITGRIGAVTVWGVIIPVVGLCLIGWFWFSPELYIAGWNPHGDTFFTALPASIAITLWAFLGLESACANSDAVENPEKAVPIAVLFGTLITAVVYIISTSVIGGIVPNAELASSDAPFGLVFAMMFNGTTGKIIELIMAIACLGSLLAWQFTVARVFKSGTDSGYFFKFFGKVTERDAPVVGMIVLGVCQTILTLMTISPNLNKQFDLLVDFSVVLNLIPYILSMSACSVIVKSSNEFSLKQIPNKQLIMIGVAAFIANAYSFYALYSAGTQAMLWGALVTFTGWAVFGKFISGKLSHPEKYINKESE